MLWVFCFTETMRLPTAKATPWILAMGVLLLVCLAEFVPDWAPALNLVRRLEWMTYDGRVRMASHDASAVATNLGAVFISDDSIGVLSEGTLGFSYGLYWPRHLYGRVVRELATQGATAVGFDIAFGDLRPDHADILTLKNERFGSDAFFAHQMGKASNVVLAAVREFVPADVFRKEAAALGDISTVVDEDGILRRVRAYADYRIWHPVIREAAHLEGVDLSRVSLDDRGAFQCLARGTNAPLPFKLVVDAQNQFNVAHFIQTVLQKEAPGGLPERAPAYEDVRVWNMGLVLAARGLGLDLAHAIVDRARSRIELHGAAGMSRFIPVDSQGRFLIDWAMPTTDTRLTVAAFEELLARDILRENGLTNETPDLFKGRLVVVGSTATGKDLRDQVATSLEPDTFGMSQHWNVANMILMNRFIQTPHRVWTLCLLITLGAIVTWLNTRSSVLWASWWVACLAAGWILLAIWLFTRFKLWMPIVLPVGGALLMTHLAMITHRVIFEQQERRRVKGVFARLVSPDVVNVLLKEEHLALGGARRHLTVYFADVRGFTELTDVSQDKAEEHARQQGLEKVEIERYYDDQAREVLRTVNEYLGAVAEIVKKHKGTLDKYIGDCVMAFWGAPTPNDQHALCCVRAAIDAQRAIQQLNQEREVENQRRDQENQVRARTNQPALSLLPLLSMGTGINTGMVTVGLMGSDAHILNYTIFGREVNLASRLEGVSGHGRIIIGENTFREIQRDDPVLAATCRELDPVTVKGIRRSVRIFEVPWK